MTKWSCFNTLGRICWCSTIFIKGYIIIYLMRLHFIMAKSLISFVSAYLEFLHWQISSMSYRPNFRNSNSIFQTTYAWNSWCCSIMVSSFQIITYNVTYCTHGKWNKILTSNSLLECVEVRGLVNKKHVQEGHEQVLQALLDYTLTCYPSVTVCLFCTAYIHHYLFHIGNQCNLI